MNNLEKKLKNHYVSLLKHDDKLDSIKSKANLTKADDTPWYKKKHILFPTLGSLCACAALAVTLTVINANNNQQIVDSTKITNAVVKLDLNPSVVISINNEGKVNSVYGANDDGKMITISENYVGKNYWSVIQNILSLEKETGYFISHKENVEYNQFAVTIYSENSDYALSFRKQIVSYLNNEDVLVNEGDVTVTDSEDYTELDEDEDNDINIEENDDFDDVQAEIDSYYQQTSDYATKVLEEFHDFAVTYEDKVSYLETALEALTSEGKDYSMYESKINRLKEKITGYITLYSQIFVEDNCTYMTKYKEFIDKKIEVLTKRSELLKQNDSASQIEELNKVDTELDAIIANLDKFRSQMLDSIKNRLDSLLATLSEFTSWVESEDFRKVISGSEFNYKYRTRQLAYINSFKNNYATSFDSWKSIMVDAKNSLKTSIQSTRK